jgi:aminocarboxymuconate-semialdehyde decarboxylase
MLGTDFPYPWVDHAVEHILATPDLTDADRASMLGDLAARLLGIGAEARAG